MEVAGADVSLRDFEWRDFLGFYVNAPILILDWSGDLKKPAAGHAHSLPLEHVGGNDDVGDACLIFKREKNKSLGRTGTLAGNDSTCHANGFVMMNAGQIGCGK